MRVGRTLVCLHAGLRHKLVDRGIVFDSLDVLTIKAVLFHEGQNFDGPVGPGWLGAAVPAIHPAGGQAAHRIVVIVQGKTHLFHVVLAGEPGRRFADFLDGRQKQADQNGDDRDHHQEFDQSEAVTTSHRSGSTMHNAPWEGRDRIHGTFIRS